VTLEPTQPSRNATTNLANIPADSLLETVEQPLNVNATFPIVIVGAGPAGLALGYQLKRRGLPFVIFDKYGPGATWARHYAHLSLHSLKPLSKLPGLPMPAHYPDFPTGEQVHTYLTGYAAHFELPIQTGVEVVSAHHDGAKWYLKTTQGVFQSHLLIAATGIWNGPVLPKLPGQDSFNGTILHSQDYKRPQDFVGKRVLVVGAGNSGTEIACAVAEVAESTGLAVGKRGILMVQYPKTVLGSRLTSRLLRGLPDHISGLLLRYLHHDFADLGLPLPQHNLRYAYPVVGFDIVEAVKQGKVTTHTSLAQFEGDEVVFSDGQRAHYDTVIMATGYRPTLGFLEDVLKNTYPETFATLVPSGLNNYQLAKVPNALFFGYDYPESEAWLHRLPEKSQRAANVISDLY
jgi:cation diffusion facilitator CzcD-associated flavoprotein CzcO